VAEGHNERIAWTADAIDVDSQDLYVETLNPSNPLQVKDGGRWVDIAVRKDWIAVRGRKVPVDFERETTRHGVIVASDQERHLAFAVRWSGSEPGAAAELAAPVVDRARSWPEFRAALARWKMPARRLTYTDADDRHGFQVAALLPVRRAWSGAVPVPGGTDATEWTGWRSLDELPHALNSKAASNGGSRASGSSSVLATQMIVEAVRAHPDRADTLLRRLASAASQSDPLTAQRAVIVDALADALRERSLAPGRDVMFAHPLGITEAARRRFNITTRAPAGGERFVLVFNPVDWDQSTAVNAPGQSGSPDSPHFADLAKVWSNGASFPLVFSEQAIASHAAATLTLTP
jgi:acyl-homoserine lactone acylase PvdQ